MNWPFAAIEEWWGERLNESLVRRIRAAPEEHLQGFLDSGSLTTAKDVLPELPPGHLRPAVVLTAVDILHGRTSSADLGSVIRQLLLYAHQVAVEDPIPKLLEALLGERRTNGVWFDEEDRAHLARVLSFLIEIRPLVDLGLVSRVRSSFRSQVRHPAFRGLENPEIFFAELGNLRGIERQLLEMPNVGGYAG
jgi:hypothetical protein